MMMMDLDGDERARFLRDLLLHHVELVLVCQHAPNHRGVLDDEIERNRAERADDAHDGLEEAEAVQRERLHDAEHVHVHADAAEEGANEVHDVRTRQREQNGEDEVRRWQRHRAPAVHADRQEYLVAEWNDLWVHHQQDALQPTFALLQEVQQRERRLLVHLALNPVERITFAERFHGEEAIFGYGAVGAVVKRNFALGVELEEKKIC